MAFERLFFVMPKTAVSTYLGASRLGAHLRANPSMATMLTSASNVATRLYNGSFECTGPQGPGFVRAAESCQARDIFVEDGKVLVHVRLDGSDVDFPVLARTMRLGILRANEVMFVDEALTSELRQRVRNQQAARGRFSRGEIQSARQDGMSYETLVINNAKARNG